MSDEKSLCQRALYWEIFCIFPSSHAVQSSAAAWKMTVNLANAACLHYLFYQQLETRRENKRAKSM
jgi:hypothetical protein